MEIATLIVNRNDASRTDALVERLRSLQRVKAQDIYVLESGSDLDRLAKSSTVWFRENVNWPMGFNLLREYADRHKRRHAKKAYAAYWMICNDVQFPDDVLPASVDPWEAMEKALEKVPDWGIAHPYQKFFTPGHPGYPLNKHGVGARRVSFVEFVCPLFSRKLLERFEEEARLGKTHGAVDLIDERYTRGWGVDYEMSYWAHALGFSVQNVDDVGCLHIPNTSHKNHQQTKTEAKDEFLNAARVEMLTEMVKKWGPEWGERFCQMIPDLPDKAFRNWSVGDRAASKQWRAA